MLQSYAGCLNSADMVITWKRCCVIGWCAVQPMATVSNDCWRSQTLPLTKLSRWCRPWSWLNEMHKNCIPANKTSAHQSRSCRISTNLGRRSLICIPVIDAVHNMIPHTVGSSRPSVMPVEKGPHVLYLIELTYLSS